MQTALPVLTVAMLVGLAIAFTVRDRRQQKRLRLRVQKLYASQLFEDMLPLLQACRKRQLEQVIVDKTGVVMRYLHFAGSESAFLMRPNGYRYLSPGQQEALRSAPALSALSPGASSLAVGGEGLRVTVQLLLIERG